MVITDQELGMLEQIIYMGKKLLEECQSEEDKKNIKEDNWDFFEKDDSNCLKYEWSIAKQLECFDEDKLTCLEQKGNKNIGYISAKEWAGIIRYLKQSKLKDLTLVKAMTNEENKTLALCFVDGNNPSEAIVAFKGTTGATEWEDNVEGLNRSDTLRQEEALDFIESLPYDNITVTGHSKGGNKAMYVALMSDKVKRCVAFDGQGFSQEFMDKYWAEIDQNGKKITEYSLSTDYVHILMYSIPNSTQVYCKGFGVDSLGEHHSSNSFFMTDADGNIFLDENNNPVFEIEEENTSMVMLHKFTIFVLRNADEEDKNKMVAYLSKILKVAFGDKKEKEKLEKIVLEDQENLAIIVAYLIKYMKLNNYSEKDINILLDSLGIVDLEKLSFVTKEDESVIVLSDFVDNILSRISDDEEDVVIEYGILRILTKLIEKNSDIIFNASKFWSDVNDKINKISGIEGCEDAYLRQGVIQDFTVKTHDETMQLMKKVGKIGEFSTKNWGKYAEEEWYFPLLIESSKKGIDQYYFGIYEMNQRCKLKIETIFQEVKRIDNTYGEQIGMRNEELKRVRKKINKLKEEIFRDNY